MAWFRESMLPDFDGIFVNEDGRLQDKDQYLVYFVDGACRFNGRSDGYGGAAYFAGPEYWSRWQDPEDPSTNNSCELQSMFGAVNRAGKMAKGTFVFSVIVNTPSIVSAIGQMSVGDQMRHLTALG